ncbi:hypothetical protein DX933_06290 [Ornithinibacillus gellani]|uniref:YtzH-like family protein n=1 Tax=Ornithinibacillus gellani TaxID=2293253 RepID=UPI000F48BAA0|nr:YtzH-like family protein [Ornithinibacillus gellani]TQS75422.1 hypothetical protein DX933_06290 [Ornithinibacillus gellani]
MTLTVEHQLELLHDILDDHLSESDGNVSEYMQIKRIVKTIMATNQLAHSTLVQQLPDIYQYGLQGESAVNLQELIQTNEQQIMNWKTAIQQASPKYYF